jgi:hypothetical protein
MSILIFAFSHTIAELVAKDLIYGEKIFLDSTERAVNDFVQHTNFADYDYALGMGMYSGKDKNEIRIETSCTNQFRRQKDDLKKLEIPYYFHSASGIKLAKGIANSYCNLVSYKILSKSPDARYTFLHIPKSFDSSRAARIIEEQLATL